MIGSRPDGLLVPSSVWAIAVPPSSPGYHACRMAFAFSFAQLSAMALPLITTTTSGLPVVFTASSSRCSARGRSRLVLVSALEAFLLDTGFLALQLRGDAHDRDDDVGIPGGVDGTGLRVRLGRHPQEPRGRDQRGIDSILMA